MSNIKNAFDVLYYEQREAILQTGDFTEEDMIDTCSVCGTVTKVVTHIKSNSIYEFVNYCRDCFHHSKPSKK